MVVKAMVVRAMVARATVKAMVVKVMAVKATKGMRMETLCLCEVPLFVEKSNLSRIHLL
jgi:hypothetical protein